MEKYVSETVCLEMYRKMKQLNSEARYVTILHCNLNATTRLFVYHHCT